jgi:hypothetical protein
MRSLGIARTTYYHWLREERWAKCLPAELPRPVQVFEAVASSAGLPRRARSPARCATLEADASPSHFRWEEL